MNVGTFNRVKSTSFRYLFRRHALIRRLQLSHSRRHLLTTKKTWKTDVDNLITDLRSNDQWSATVAARQERKVASDPQLTLNY